MSGIRNLTYAAKDKFGGSTNLLNTTPYLSRKPIKITGPIEELEHLSILIDVYYDLMIDYKKAVLVQEMMAEDYPEVVALAKDWYNRGKLANYHHLKIEDVYHMMNVELNHNKYLQTSSFK